MKIKDFVESHGKSAWARLTTFGNFTRADIDKEIGAQLKLQRFTPDKGLLQCPVGV